MATGTVDYTWNDPLVTSFASATPMQECKRFDKKKKTMIHNISMPDIVSIYNKLMGAVDLADYLIFLYRIKTKSIKSYRINIFPYYRYGTC